MKAKRKVVAFFSGVGGIELGFEQSGGFEVVYANEFDHNAQITYQENFPETFLDQRDLHLVNAEDLSDSDIFVGGFPCQAFSVAGYQKGFTDNRGDLFFVLLKLIKAKKPQAIFLENVKNLVTHDHGKTFRIICESLTTNGYFIKWKVLNSKDYGNVPQNRERIYIVGFRDKKAFDNFKFPEKIKLTAKLDSIINFADQVAEKYYYRADKQKFYDQLVLKINSKNSVYQWRRQYVRENKAGLVPTLTANMGTGGHNVPLIYTDYGIRKLTPRETFNAQGFPKDFKLPSQLADSHLYKQAGNSVVVPVIKRIAENIAQALDFSEMLDQPELKELSAGYVLIKSNVFDRYSGCSYIEQSFSNYPSSINLGELDDQEYFKKIKKNKPFSFYSLREVDHNYLSIASYTK